MSQRITPAEFQLRAKADPKLTLIDVRTPVEFEAIHVPGARNIPLNELDAKTLAANGTIREGEPIYLICHSGNRTRLAADTLANSGFPNTVQIDGGTQAWEKDGLAVVRGDSRGISIERQVRIGAGSLVVLGLVLGYTVHRYFVGLSALVGCGLIFAGVTDWCGMGLLLAKAPWNQRKTP